MAPKQVDLRRHNAAAAVREAERCRAEAVARASAAEASRAQAHAEIASVSQSPTRCTPLHVPPSHVLIPCNAPFLGVPECCAAAPGICAGLALHAATSRAVSSMQTARLRAILHACRGPAVPCMVVVWWCMGSEVATWPVQCPRVGTHTRTHTYTLARMHAAIELSGLLRC